MQVEFPSSSADKPAQVTIFSYQEVPGLKGEVKTYKSLEAWKLLGQGRDGKLESWMRETEMGIEDDSG